MLIIEKLKSLRFSLEHWCVRYYMTILGTVVKPAVVWLTPAANPERPPDKIQVIPVEGSFLSGVRVGHTLEIEDLRNKARHFLVETHNGNSFYAVTAQTSYLGPDLQFESHRKVRIVIVFLMKLDRKDWRFAISRNSNHIESGRPIDSNT